MSKVTLGYTIGLKKNEKKNIILHNISQSSQHYQATNNKKSQLN